MSNDHPTLEDATDEHRAMFATVPPDTERHPHRDVGAEVIKNLLDSHLEAEREERRLFHQQMKELFEGLKKSIDMLTERMTNSANTVLEANERSRKNEERLSHAEARITALESWREEQADDGR